MISVSPVGVNDVEVVTLELEEEVGEANNKEEERDAPVKMTALEKEEDDDDDEIVEVGRVRKRRTVRRSTGVGGKAPHLAINFRQVRKSLPVASSKQVKVKEVPEYFDVEGEEEEEDEEGVDDVQVEKKTDSFLIRLYFISSSFPTFHTSWFSGERGPFCKC